jgi:hypothetical protein
VIAKPNVAPSVSLTGPAADAQFTQGDNINITANAADADGTISKVEFFNGSTLLGTDTTSPYSFAWTTAPLGISSLTAKATDDKGTVTVSAGVTINIDEKESNAILIEVAIPEVIIVTPVNNQEFDAGTTIELMVMFQGSDESVKKVEYYVGSQLIGSSITSPFGFTWQTAGVGQHNIVVKAIGEDTSRFKISESASILVKGGISYFSEPVAVNISEDISSVRLDYVIGPNPTTDYLNVIFTNLDGIYDFELRVVSMNGTVKKTFQARPEDSTVTVDVSDLINGVYILQVIANGNNISSKRFIKK